MEDRKQKDEQRTPPEGTGLDRRAFLLRGSAALAGAAVGGPALASGDDAAQPPRPRRVSKKAESYDPNDLQAGWFAV